MASQVDSVAQANEKTSAKSDLAAVAAQYGFADETPEQRQLNYLCINTIRTLSMDAVQKAKSGHPGTPMDAAPAAYTLWQRMLRYDPANPSWINRDRFVLSSGHASMLLYSLIHLTGIKAINPSYEQVGREAVTLDDIKTFRQAGSRCPGHPEYGWTTGVETTTGPLGQGAATSVGMAIASKWLSATYNRPGFDLFDKQPTGCADPLPQWTCGKPDGQARTGSWLRMGSRPLHSRDDTPVSSAGSEYRTLR